MEEREPGIGDLAPGLDVAELALPRQRVDGAIAGARGVRDAALPAHVKTLEPGQMAQNLEPAIGDPAARAFAQIELLELRHARQVPKAVIGEPLRTPQVETGHVTELWETLHHGIGHPPVGVEARDLHFLHHAEDGVPTLCRIGSSTGAAPRAPPRYCFGSSRRIRRRCCRL